MTATTPTGEYSLPLYYLRETLATSATFQTWVGATTGDAAAKLIAARTKIFYYGTTSETRPFAVITHADSFDRRKVADGSHHWFATVNNGLKLTFDADIVTADASDMNEAVFKFTNNVGAIFTDMEALAGTAGYLAFTSYSIKNPRRCGREQREATDDTAMDIWQLDCEINIEEG